MILNNTTIVPNNSKTSVDGVAMPFPHFQECKQTGCPQERRNGRCRADFHAKGKAEGGIISVETLASGASCYLKTVGRHVVCKEALRLVDGLSHKSVGRCRLQDEAIVRRSTALDLASNSHPASGFPGTEEGSELPACEQYPA